MAGFPAITDSDGGMGFSSSDMIAELCFWPCCFLTMLVVIKIFFDVRKTMRQRKIILKSDKE